MTSLVVSSPGLTPLKLDDPDAGWVVTSVDVGAPQVRQVVSTVPQGHGTVDDTQWVGARGVVASMTLASDPATLRGLLDRVAPFLDVSRRVTLTLGDGVATRSLTVRSDGDVPVPWEKPGLLEMSLGWVTVGTPFWRSTETRQIVLSPVDPVSPGWSPPLTPPLTFPYSVGVGNMVAVNVGTINAPWVARIYGPIVGPALVNRTTGERVSLAGLVVAAGDFIEVDSELRTVRLNGLPDASRYGSFDFAASSWWTLQPGSQTIYLASATSSTPAQATLTWRDTYLI